MLHPFDVKASDTIATIESNLLSIERKLTADLAQPRFRARVASGANAPDASFREEWASIALASLDSRLCHEGTAVAWGIPDWEDSSADNSRLAAKLPYQPAGLYAIGSGLPITTDSTPPVPLDPERVIQSIRDERFVLGRDGSSHRLVVEFDARVRTVPELRSDPILARRKFRRWIVQERQKLEINGNQRDQRIGDEGAAGCLADFLFELRMNGLQYAASAGHVRTLKLKKRSFPNRGAAVKWAKGFPQLANYIEREYPRSGETYLIEAAVSDYGPGIVDGFLHSPRGKDWPDVDRRDLLRQLLLTPLSSNWSDPGAGYGIQDALKAASRLSAFVSLRTGEFWAYQDPSEPSVVDLSNCSDSPLAKVPGTHWQLVYPHAASISS